MCVPGACRIQKESDPLKWELKVIMSLNVDSGIESGCS